MFRITIPTRHAAVVYSAGRLVGVEPAGRVRRRWAHRYVLVDLRERQQVIAPQDIPTSDGLGVRVSAVVRWAVIDPVAWLEVSRTPVDVLHIATQLALREAVGAPEPTDLIGAMRRLDVTTAVDAATRAVGIATLGVAVRDVVLPHDLRLATAELVTAKLRGAAALEAARSETAALRALANGARLLDEHPALAQLRLVQATPPGTRLVLRWVGRRSRRPTDRRPRRRRSGRRAVAAGGLPGMPFTRGAWAAYPALARGHETKVMAFAGVRVSMLRPRFWWSSISAAHPIIRPKRNTVKAAFSN